MWYTRYIVGADAFFSPLLTSRPRLRESGDLLDQLRTIRTPHDDRPGETDEETAF
jgi:hypothetical protein